MKKIIETLFTICLLVFMAGGTLLVLGQLLGVILQNGDLMVKVTDMVAEPTFIIAAITGFLGFVYSYFPKEAKK